jgi:hypothetical protein
MNDEAQMDEFGITALFARLLLSCSGAHDRLLRTPLPIARRLAASSIHNIDEKNVRDFQKKRRQSR